VFESRCKDKEVYDINQIIPQIFLLLLHFLTIEREKRAKYGFAENTIAQNNKEKCIFQCSFSRFRSDS